MSWHRKARFQPPRGSYSSKKNKICIHTINFNMCFLLDHKTHCVLKGKLGSFEKCSVCCGPFSSLKWWGLRCEGLYKNSKIDIFHYTCTLCLLERHFSGLTNFLVFKINVFKKWIKLKILIIALKFTHEHTLGTQHILFQISECRKKHQICYYFTEK